MCVHVNVHLRHNGQMTITTLFTVAVFPHWPSAVFFPSSSPSLKSYVIWKLASFGKLAIRTILLEYVSVSLVFLPINSWRGGSG